MMITCTNKGCLKSSDAKLNVETDEVICQECGKPIDNISAIMKKTLKSAGQIVRNNDKKPFMVRCSKCKANRVIVIDKDGNTVCGTCKTPIKVSKSFQLAMEEAGVKMEKLKE